MRILLDGGGDVNQVDGAGRTPAIAAALIGDHSMLQFLSAGESGADLSVRNSDGRTAAFCAAMNGHTGCLALILGDADYGREGGGGGLSGEAKGEATTSAAATSGGVPVIADPAADAADKIGCTPLWTAAAHGHLDTVKYLIDRHGASPNARDVTGTTAAWMTVSQRTSHIAITACVSAVLVACVYRSSGEPRARPPPTKTATDGAATSHACHFILGLLREKPRQTPLARPVPRHPRTSCLFLTPPITKQTAVPQAGSGNTRCLKLLLDAGADGDLANEDGLTPALIAAQGGHAGCIRALAKAGADLSIRDLSGNSAAALAAMGGHLNCLEVGDFALCMRFLCLVRRLHQSRCQRFTHPRG